MVGFGDKKFPVGGDKKTKKFDILVCMLYISIKQVVRQSATPPKRDEQMPIIITLHISGLTVTVRIKSRAATLPSDGP